MSETPKSEVAAASAVPVPDHPAACDACSAGGERESGNRGNPAGASDRDPKVDRQRRTWMIATTVLGGAGGVAAITPLLDSMNPSERTRAAAAPTDIDLSALTPGQCMTVAWRGLPVWVLNRTPAMMAEVRAADADCADPTSLRTYSMPMPAYCRNGYRSRVEHPEIVVLVGVCTHLGCTPAPRFTPGAQVNLPADWPGGWLCPCHGSTFDLAGRVFKNKPAPLNLDIPRYMFTSPTRLVIGRDEQGEA